ncbi:uncharacterized protein M6B38_398600 [Iris pallida]|uniref:Histone acetyltransferase n=1 Tax=Iris pallida TaxID=29817 RepID=A0AAX6FV46_IRIPA|nr:uncharacterized protein M6B38_398600 [Iris pallida]
MIWVHSVWNVAILKEYHRTERMAGENPAGEKVIRILDREEMEDLATDGFEGSKEEYGILMEVLYRTRINDASSSNFLPGTTGFQPDGGSNIRSGSSVLTSPSSFKESGHGVLAHSKMNVGEGNGIRFSRETYSWTGWDAGSANVKQPKLSHALAEASNGFANLSSSKVGTNMCSPDSSDVFPKVPCRIVETFGHGVLSSYYMPCLRNITLGSNVTDDGVLSNSEERNQHKKDGETLVEEKSSASPGSHGSHASQLVVSGTRVVLEEGSRHKEDGNLLLEEKSNHSPGSHDGYCSQLILSGKPPEVLEKTRKALASRRAEEFRITDANGNKKHLRDHAFHLLRKAGWGVIVRRRKQKDKKDYYYRSPEGHLVYSLAKSWILCGRMLQSASLNSECDQYGRQWSNIDDFWGDLTDTLVYIEKELRHGENNARSTLLEWQLLDPFMAVVCIDQKMRHLQHGKPLGAVKSATFGLGEDRNMIMEAKEDDYISYSSRRPRGRLSLIPSFMSERKPEMIESPCKQQVSTEQVCPEPENKRKFAQEENKAHCNAYIRNRRLKTLARRIGKGFYRELHGMNCKGSSREHKSREPNHSVSTRRSSGINSSKGSPTDVVLAQEAPRLTVGKSKSHASRSSKAACPNNNISTTNLNGEVSSGSEEILMGRPCKRFKTDYTTEARLFQEKNEHSIEGRLVNKNTLHCSLTAATQVEGLDSFVAQYDDVNQGAVVEERDRSGHNSGSEVNTENANIQVGGIAHGNTLNNSVTTVSQLESLEDSSISQCDSVRQVVASEEYHTTGHNLISEVNTENSTNISSHKKELDDRIQQNTSKSGDGRNFLFLNQPLHPLQEKKISLLYPQEENLSGAVDKCRQKLLGCLNNNPDEIKRVIMQQEMPSSVYPASLMGDDFVFGGNISNVNFQIQQEELNSCLEEDPSLVEKVVTASKSRKSRSCKNIDGASKASKSGSKQKRGPKPQSTSIRKANKKSKKISEIEDSKISVRGSISHENCGETSGLGMDYMINSIDFSAPLKGNILFPSEPPTECLGREEQNGEVSKAHASALPDANSFKKPRKRSANSETKARRPRKSKKSIPMPLEDQQGSTLLKSNGDQENNREQEDRQHDNGDINTKFHCEKESLGAAIVANDEPPSIKSQVCKESGQKRLLGCRIYDNDLLVSAINKNKESGSASRAQPAQPRTNRKHKRGRGSTRREPTRGTTRNRRDLSIDKKQTILSTKTVLYWLIEMGIISTNDTIQYRDPKSNTVVKEGRISKGGIICKCCNDILCVSRFKFHAGFKVNRPALNLFLTSGRTYTLCQLQAWSVEYKRRKHGIPVKEVEEMDENDDACALCGDGGELICCDSCPSSYHQTCLPFQDLPEGSWYCPHCICDICGDVINASEASSASIAVKCLQCGKKYHQTCVKENISCKGEVEPESWFCGENCEELFVGLHSLVGEMNRVGDGFYCSILRCTHGDQKLHSAHKIASMAECHTKLAVALKIMEECFIPMLDPRTGVNMIPHALYNWGSRFERLNYEGFYTAILEQDDEIISVASIRVHGVTVAEMPLIATCTERRGQGMCRRLVRAIEEILRSYKVKTLVIAAIPDLVDTWLSGFGYELVEEDERKQLSEMNLMLFPGTILVKKSLYQVKVKEPGHAKENNDLLSRKQENPSSGVFHDTCAGNGHRSAGGNPSSTAEYSKNGEFLNTNSLNSKSRTSKTCKEQQTFSAEEALVTEKSTPFTSSVYSYSSSVSQQVTRLLTDPIFEAVHSLMRKWHRGENVHNGTVVSDTDVRLEKRADGVTDDSSSEYSKEPCGYKADTLRGEGPQKVGSAETVGALQNGVCKGNASVIVEEKVLNKCSFSGKNTLRSIKKLPQMIRKLEQSSHRNSDEH